MLPRHHATPARILIRSACACALLSLLALGGTGLSAQQRSTPFDRASDVLRNRFAKDLPFSVRTSCLSYVEEEATSRRVTIAVREKHDATCGGDPDVSPIIDRFRVTLATGHIEFYDALEDDWRDYADYKKNRR